MTYRELFRQLSTDDMDCDICVASLEGIVYTAKLQHAKLAGSPAPLPIFELTDSWGDEVDWVDDDELELRSLRPHKHSGISYHKWKPEELNSDRPQ
jgi:hypothetical protein